MARIPCKSGEGYILVPIVNCVIFSVYLAPGSQFPKGTGVGLPCPLLLPGGGVGEVDGGRRIGDRWLGLHHLSLSGLFIKQILRSIVMISSELLPLLSDKKTEK